MNLQAFIADIVTLVNNIIIPFILGMAFLFFVINVIRFFVIGGTTDDGKEKSKRLAVYGVSAFVLILVFWGIVNLLTSSLGLQQFGEGEARCFDYECPDGNNPAQNIQTTGVGGGFGSTHPGGATIAEPSIPSNPSVPPNRLNQPGGLGASTPDSAPTIPNSVAPDYTSVTSGSLTTVYAVFPLLERSLLSDQFSRIGTASMPDSVRVNTARAFADAGLISEAEFLSVLNAINAVRTQSGFPSIAASFAVADPQYTEDLTTYSSNVASTEQILTTWYGAGITVESEIDRLFNTEYSLSQREAAIEEVLQAAASRDGDQNAALEANIKAAMAVEEAYTQ